MDMNKKHSLTSVDFVTYRDFFVPVVSIFVFNASEHILLDGFVTKEPGGGLPYETDGDARRKL